MIDLNDPANWDKPLFPLVVVAQGALVAAATLRQWIVRYADDLKLWEGSPGDVAGSVDQPAGAKAESNGRAHRFSLRAALHIAASSRLIARGVPVKEAYLAAARWAHIGAFDYAVYANEPEPGLVRRPGGLFAEPALTFLIHHGGDDARIVGVERESGKLPFRYSDLFALGYPVAVAPTIVQLNDVDRYVRGVCGGYLRDDQTAN
ncbi:hypothetical protein SAMN06295912_13627 [Sphingomonas laterariae]|uniref:Uncharacterized protein n=1 Tax=Edaphosphingomonas laterariae TaxID=861865 RepID=A0A239JPG5_9SPHN|nr:hypothetical protein [Sphingomonas laterariae]SNT07308.1 hypothetical protein SAMN06295912_13627 [Sphingomonas laterariae]